MKSVKWVGFDLTNRCNAKCEHCFISSGPDRTEEMPVADVLRWIDEIGPMKQISWVIFSGGEPFIYKGLVEVARRARAYGKNLRIYTNCFWAKDLDSAKRKLQELRPKQLIVSADVFHQKFVKMENVKNAIRACRALGIHIIVNCRGTNAEDIRAELEAEFKNLDTEEQDIAPVGRANGNTDPEIVNNLVKPGPPEKVAIAGCHEYGRLVRVMPSGVVHFCCSMSELTNEHGPMVTGNAYKSSLKSIIENIDPVLSIPHRGNLCRMISVVRGAGLGHLLKKEYPMRCAVCQEIMGNPEMKAAIKSFYDRPGERVYVVDVPLHNGKKIKLRVKEMDLQKAIREKRKLPPLADLLNNALKENFSFSTRPDGKEKCFPISLLGDSTTKILDIAYGSKWREAYHECRRLI